jgi:cystathionine beta-lyase/cystathionine gamma-synthase
MASLVMDDSGNYTRTCSLSRDKLENKLRTLYNSTCCEIVSSGINAIHITLFTIFDIKKESIVLVADEIFDYTVPVINQLSEIFKKTIIKFNPENTDQIINLINLHKDNLCCMFFESCSNPSSKSIDWNAFEDYRKYLTTIVDNTWLSPAKFNPLQHNADIIIDSCTKYISGGKCIAGAINFNNYNDITIKCQQNVSLMGIHVSKEYCLIIVDSMDTIYSRVKTATDRTLEIISNIKNNKKILEIKYNYKFNPCVFTICLESKIEKIKEVEKKLKLLTTEFEINYSTSFGKNHDSIDTYPTINEKGVWIRVAVGYESDDKIVLKLNNLINKFCA